MAVRIIGIQKDEGLNLNPYLAIDNLEWVNERINVKGVTERAQIYDWIKSGNIAYVTDDKGNRAHLIPDTCPQGNKFVKTANDAATDALLSLPLSS